MNFLDEYGSIKYNIVQGGNKLCILFGWAGSSQKNLSKYSQIYEKLEISTIQMIQESAFNAAGVKDEKMFRKVLDCLESQFHVSKNSKFEIYFHLFSNGGLGNYTKMIEMLEDDKYDSWRSNIKSSFFDSCPGTSDPYGGAIATSVWIQNAILRNLAFGIMFVLFTILWLLGTVGFLKDPFIEMTEKVVNTKVLKNSRFYVVYSKQDELIPFVAVENFVNVLKSQDRAVEVLLLDSPHVQHLLKYREKYEKLIEKSVK